MNIERFSIPELLFHPSDIGIHEMGVAEAVVHTIAQTPPGSFNVQWDDVIFSGKILEWFSYVSVNML